MPPVQSKNLDSRTVGDFGAEWSKFDQTRLSDRELDLQFNEYFDIFPWGSLPPGAIGFDAGCGSGRWAKRVAPRVGGLRCIDASPEATAVALANLSAHENTTVQTATIDALPFEDGSMDFGYSLGVLHHLPDPEQGLRSCVAKLKPGAPMLVYIYYALDDRPAWFRGIWRSAEAARRLLCRLPFRMKLMITTLIATLVYWPLARVALIAEKLQLDPDRLVLASYRHRSFYSMRTDALDRFGTRVEHRFRRDQIWSMMARAGLCQISFSDHTPYWCAVGRRSSEATSRLLFRLSCHDGAGYDPEQRTGALVIE
jgi:SAM-dependent methyltransferase